MTVNDIDSSPATSARARARPAMYHSVICHDETVHESAFHAVFINLDDLSKGLTLWF